MSITRLEAWDRATMIWGEQVRFVKERHEREGWCIELYNESLHVLDGAGHAVCHTECTEIEVQVCR